MLSPVEDFWLHWHAEHSSDDLAGRARLVLEAETGGSPGQVAASLGLSTQAAEGVLAEFEHDRLATFPRPKLRLDQLIDFDSASTRRRQHVAHVARRLFNDTRPLHHLPSKARQLLEAAALLPPVVDVEPAATPPQQDPVLLDGAILADLGPTEQAMVGCVLHLQRKGYRSDRDLNFKRLRPYQQSQVRYLAALLQVSLNLDHSGTQTTSLKGAELQPDTVILRVLGPKATADGAFACRRSKLWQPAFHSGLQHALGARSTAAASPEETLGRDEPASAVFGRQMSAAVRKCQTSLPGAAAGDLSSLADLLAGVDQARAALGAFASVLKRGPVKAMKPPLRSLRDLLASITVEQAALSDLETYLAGRAPEALAELQPMREAWEHEVRRKQAVVRTALEDEAMTAVLAALTHLAETPPVRRHKATTIHAAAPVLLEEVCDEVAEREAQVAPDRPKSYQRYRDGLARLAGALEALGGKASMGEEAERLLSDAQRLDSRIDRWLASSALNDAIAEFLDAWAEQQARRKAPQLFGAQAVLAYRQARRAQWSRLRSGLARDWRPLRANRLRRRANGLLKQLARHE